LIRRKTAKEEAVKNVFSAEEKTPEVDPAFYDQPQAGTQPTAPSCNPKVPAPAPVPIQPPTTGSPPPSSPTVTGAPSRSFGQSQLVPTQQPTLKLEVGKGTAIKLPGPATTVFVAAPDIADVQVKSPGMIYVFAKKPGDTVLYAVDDQDRVLLNTIVSVSSPFSRMKTALDAQHPGNAVSFDNVNDSIVLAGTVRSAVIAEDARKIAVQYTGSNAKIVNNIRIDAPTQVQLRVKVAEVNRGSLKRVGINWQNINNIALFGMGGILGGFVPGGFGALASHINISAKTADVVLKNKLGTFASQQSAAIQSLGADFSALSAEDAAKLGIDGGVQVTNIQENGIIGSQTNMRPGFVITRIGDQSIKTVDQLKEVLSNQSANFQIQGIYPGSKEVYYYGINDFKK